MTKHLSAYVNDVLPGHSVRSIRRGERALGPSTVVARFADVESASRAAVAVVDDPTRDVDVVAILRPSRDPAVGSGARIASESIRQVSVARVATWSTIGGIIGALVAFAVCAVMDTTTAVSLISALAGFVLGSIVGATLGGLGRFGGEHAWEEAGTRAPEPIGGAVAVHVPDDASAETVARRMSACDGAMDVRVLDERGFWHAPRADA